MSPVHGSKAVFSLDNSAGALQNLTAYLNSVSAPNFDVDMAESTTLGKTAKTYVPGLSDATISIEGPWDTVLDAHLAGLLGNGATWTFEYGPAGNASGAIRYTGECYITSYSAESSVDDLGTCSAELQVTGPVTRNTYP